MNCITVMIAGTMYALSFQILIICTGLVTKPSVLKPDLISICRLIECRSIMPSKIPKAPQVQPKLQTKTSRLSLNRSTSKVLSSTYIQLTLTPFYSVMSPRFEYLICSHFCSYFKLIYYPISLGYSVFLVSYAGVRKPTVGSSSSVKPLKRWQ